jgi:hypothetical protein
MDAIVEAHELVDRRRPVGNLDAHPINLRPRATPEQSENARRP